MTMAPGEIWSIAFRWHDGTTVQQRPVLVISVSGDRAIYVQIRGNEDMYGNQRTRRWEDFDIVDWQSAGLRKPSHARFEKEFDAPLSMFTKKIGNLSSSDILKMRHSGYRIG